MNSYTTTMFEYGAIESYRRDLKIAEMICASKIRLRILILYMMLVSVILNSKKMMTHLKSQLDKSENNRDHLTAEVCNIRDGLVTLYELSQKTRFMMLFNRSLDKITIDWDDFAEECTVISDPEIKELLHRVNNAI
jgi:hypothetical protein